MSGPYSDKGPGSRLASVAPFGAVWRLLRGWAWGRRLATAARAYLAARDRVDPAGEAEARRRLEALLAEAVE